MPLSQRTIPTARYPGQRPGVTLVEVLGALVLLGVLVASMMSARTLYHRQSVAAQRKQAAVTAADKLLTSWWGDLEKFPTGSQGGVPGDSQLRWRTSIISQPQLEPLRVKVVRLEILSPINAVVPAVSSTTATPADQHDESTVSVEPPALVTVDVVIPDPAAKEDTKNPGNPGTSTQGINPPGTNSQGTNTQGIQTISAAPPR